MPFYLVKGNAEELFPAFGLNWIIREETDNTETMKKDLPRANFLGTEEQAIRHFNLWDQHILGQYYCQGNLSAGNLKFLLGNQPFMKENEAPEQYAQNFISHDFTYVNDDGETCGLMVGYRQDDPTQWMMGLLKKAYAAPKDRELIFLSSSDFRQFIQLPGTQVSICEEDFFNTQFMQEINSVLPCELLRNVFFHTERGGIEINKRFKRIDLLLRFLQIDQKTVKISDPISERSLNLPALFADNPDLDFLVQYKLSLSFTLLKECLSGASRLHEEIEAIKRIEDEGMKRHVLKMTLVFYEQGLLEQNRASLNNLEFIKKLSGYMWDEMQIKLIPFLIEKQYDADLIRFILLEKKYYGAVNRLVELDPAFLQDIPQFFREATKLEELKEIDEIPDEECKKLCLLFWVKGTGETALSLDGYRQIIEATKQYPLLASTLVALDKTNQATIDELKQLILFPKKHLRESIKYHFAKEITGYHWAHWSENELNNACNALILLKKSQVTDHNAYQAVLKNNKKGVALRLILPQLAAHNEIHQKILIQVLYHKKPISTPLDPEELALAKNMGNRYECVILLHKLNVAREMIELAAQAETQEARCFQQIISEVEAQCQKITERLSRIGGSSESQKREDWTAQEKEYRKTVYRIAFKGLQPNANLAEQRLALETATKNILNIVDPEIKSYLEKSLIAITNMVISLLTAGIVNLIKYKHTGNYWFFNHTRSGEELRVLNNKIVDLIASNASNPLRTQEPNTP